MLKLQYLTFSLFLLLFAGCSGTYDVEGDVDVAITDQTTQSINSFLSKKISDINLTQNLTLGQQTFNITSNVAPVVGDYICLKDIDGNAFTQDEIEVVNSLGGNLYEITIHSGSEYAYSTEDGCSLRTINMAVDGSINQEVFTISALGLNENVEWHITRIICTAIGDGVGATDDKPDDGDFLTTSATNDGIFLRARNNFFYKNIFHATTNAEIRNNMLDLITTDASRVAGLYSVTFRLTWNGKEKHGVVIPLSADNLSEYYHYLDMVIQRDLTDLESFTCKLQGHETTKYESYLIEVYESVRNYYLSIFS